MTAACAVLPFVIQFPNGGAGENGDELTDDNDSVPERCWRSPPKSAIRWVEWDGEFVAFHRKSGSTHFLNASSKLLIEDTLSEPKSVRGVADEFAVLPNSVDERSHLEDVSDMLMRFDELGLIRRL